MLAAMTLSEMLEAWRAGFEALAGEGEPNHAEPELEQAVDELGLEPDDEVDPGTRWELFSTVVAEYHGRGGPEDELLTSFMLTWAGPYPEEQFLDVYELRDQLSEGEFPASFTAHIETAVEGYTLYEEPPRHAAVRTPDGGWVLAYPDRIVELATPGDLIAYLKSHASR